MRTALLALLCLPALAQAGDARRLAVAPETEVIGDQCRIQGAVVLGGAPLAHASLELVDPETGQAHPVRTGADGLYVATLPAGPVYRERLTAETRRRATLTGSLVAPRAEMPWVICRQGVVEVGSVSSAGGAP